jgi:hypothetical protein
MKNIISNRVNMIRVTLNYLTANTTATTGIAAFAGVKTTADNKLALIDQLTQIADSTTGGVTLDTNIIRSTMSNIALKCGDAVSAYAASVNNNTLRARVTYTLPQLNKLKKEEVDDVCQTIHDEANTHIAAAGPFGYDAADITDLQTAIDLYRIGSQNPRQAIISRSEAKNNIKLLVREVIEDIFGKQIDKMVNTLKLSNIEFVNNYYRSREIIDLGSTTAKVRGTIKNPEEVPLVDVKFTIRKTGQLNKVAETLSTTGGKFGIANLLPGFYDFTWQYPNYHTITETNIKITAGKELRRNITMQPVTSQTITLQGVVRNQATNSVIAGAIIAVGSHNTVSQNDGSYFLQFPPAALNYNISVSATGFQTNNTNMPLQPGQTITHNIELTPVATMPAGSISGLVTASNTGMGIANAFVELTPGNYSANTDSMGNYSINNVPAGNYTLTASAPGYTSNQHLITINPNSNTNNNIALNPNP